jgi:transcription elongation factor GreA
MVKVSQAGVDTLNDGVVRLGSRVRVELQEDDERGEAEFALVADRDADATAHRVSEASPIGRALMGRRAGDRVKFRAPGGTVGATVVSVGR